MKVKEKKINLADKFRSVHLKKDDEVIVIAGSEKGKRGKIMFIDRIRSRVYVQGIKKIKRYQRPTQENPQGGVIEVESSIHLSNVMFYDSKSKKGVRLGTKSQNGKKVRVTRPEGREV
jgi:large subunit ribosomal protein L24